MQTRLEKISLISIQWVGSINSLILHTLLFIISFFLYFLGIDFDKVLLVLTTIVSLEAIYLAIFIQMSVNIQSKRLNDVAENVEDIQEDVEDIQEDVDDIQENFDELQKDIEEIQKDVEEIQKEDEDEEEDEILVRIENNIVILMKELNKLKKQQYKNNFRKL